MRAYKIGVFTVSITVAFVVLIYNILDVSPSVFLKLSQDQIGESDIIFRSMSASNISESGDVFMYGRQSERPKPPPFTLPFVNATEMQQVVADSSYYDGLSPRWFSIASFANTTNTDLSTPGIVLIIDTK